MTNAEKYFETFEGHLPSFAHLVSRRINQWKSKKLILQGKGYTSISPDGSNELIWLSLQKIQPQGAPNIQTRDETTKPPEEEIPIQAMAALKICKKPHSTSPTL